MEGKEGKIFCQSMTDDERRNVFGEGYFAYLAKISKKKGAMVGYIIAFLAVGVLCNIPGWGFRIDMDLIMDGTHEVSAITVVLGVLGATHENSLLDRAISTIGTITSCIPEFWFSLLLIFMFSVIWHVLPSSGAYSVGKEGDLLDRIRHLIMPMIVVIFEHLWYYAYMVRNKLLEEVRSDYVSLFKSVGINRRRIVFGHCLKNIMPTIVSIMAISVPHIIGGTYIVESVFSYPGIGMLSYESARYGDYNMLMVLCMMTGIVIIFCNILGQIINEKIDPRIKANEITERSEVSYGDGQ